MERKKYKNNIVIDILAFLFAVAASSALMVSLLIPADLKTVTIVSLITIFLLTFMFTNKKTATVSLVLLGIAAIVSVVVINRGGSVPIVQQTIHDYVKWVIQAVTALRPEVKLFIDITRILITVLTSSVCYFFIIKKISMIPLLIVFMPVYIVPYLNQGVTGFFPMLAGAVVMVILFAISVFRAQGVSFFKEGDIKFELKYLLHIIPMVLFLVIGSWGLSHAHRQNRSSQMDQTVRKIENKLEEWNIIVDKQFEFGGEFTLQSSGFQQGGTLGGNILEKNDLAMIVESSEPVYLKGSIRDIYTGFSWKPGLRRATIIRSVNLEHYVTDTSFSDRKVFEAAMRAINFNLERADYDTFFKEGKVEIAHYGLKTNTLFYPDNLVYVELAKQNNRKIRINNNGELFFPFNVVSNSRYTIGYRTFVTGNPYSEYILQNLEKGILDEWLERSENIPLKEKYEYIYDRYVSEDNISNKVRELASSITKEATNRYDKAKAIESYLKDNFNYTLSPGGVPADANFVDYFLFTGKTGYCTYYASAMTVMLRSLGIPARYVEGYVAKTENKMGRSYSILQKNSHAWVEVFFEGVGWIVFEPTPAEQIAVVPGEGESSGDVTGETPDNDLDIWEWDEGYLEEYFELPDMGYIDDDKWDIPGNTFDPKEDIPWLYILYAIVGIAVLFYPVKIILIKIKLLADRKKSANHAVLAYYNRILKLLDIAGLGVRPGETLFEMTDRKHIVIKSGGKELKKATEAYLSIRFADMKRNAKDFQNVYFVYKKINDNIRFFLGPGKFFVRRYIKGFKIW